MGNICSYGFLEGSVASAYCCWSLFVKECLDAWNTPDIEKRFEIQSMVTKKISSSILSFVPAPQDGP
ncbi:MAG: hypothetical protein JWQ40_2615 [Segetibacter sp.]|nr:hypothetical protein [Segetibacter sp.]